MLTIRLISQRLSQNARGHQCIPSLCIISVKSASRRLSSSNSDMDYTKFLSEMSKRRVPSVLRELTKIVLTAPKGTISLSTGMPSPTTFPFEEINVSLKNGDKFAVNGEELKSALQYQPSLGYPNLIKVIQNLQDQEHGPQDWTTRNVLITTGSMDGISRAVDMLLNIGDPIIVQHPLYSGIQSLLQAYNPRYILAEQDEDGVNPSLLHQTLEDYKKTGNKMPKVLYINPTGANPTGTTLTTDRKKALYKIAQEYDLIILEDDAYFFLHFLETNPVSLLSLDTDGRVLRFDSFSKILSSGLRLGITTGPQPLLRQIELHVQTTNLQTSSIAQVLTYQLLKTWGDEELQKHYRSVRNFYKERRNVMLEAAEKHLRGLAEWTIPNGGMFLWIKVHKVSDTYEMVMKRGITEQIVLVPGKCFHVDSSKPSPYIRAAYSIASEEEIDEGMARLAALIKAEQRLKEEHDCA